MTAPEQFAAWLTTAMDSSRSVLERQLAASNVLAAYAAATTNQKPEVKAMNAPPIFRSTPGVTVSTAYVECGCGERYTPAAFAALPRVGRQDMGGAYLMLANCVCGSMLSVQWCGTDGCTCADVLNHGFEGPANADFAGEGL